jgi:hypothetical protein
MDYAEGIKQMMAHVLDGDNIAAQTHFDDLIAAKVSTALDGKKVDLAQTIYNKGSEDV